MGMVTRLLQVGGISLAAILFFGESSNAQNLRDALAKAYSTNPTLAAERAGLHAQDEKVPQALSGWRPTINLTGRLNRDFTDSVTDFTFSAGEKTITTQSIELELSQPLYRGGRTSNETKSAEEMVFAARAVLANTEQRVLLAAATAHLDVVRAQEVVSLSINNEEVLVRQLQAVKDRFEVGELTRTDVSQAEARVANARASRVAAEGDLSISQSNYQAVIGEMPGQLAFPTADNVPQVFDPARGRQLSMARNPAIVSAIHYEKAALYDISAAAGVLLPEITLDSSIARLIDPTTFTDEQDRFQIGVTGRVPLYQSGSEYARVRELRMIAVQRRREVEEARRNIAEEYSRSWEALITARARMVSFQASVLANEIALDGVNQEAEVGARTILDVLDAEQELFEAKVNLVRAQRDEVVAIFQLVSVTGHMTARSLNLPVQLYDPGYHYHMVKDKWAGFDEKSKRSSIFDLDMRDLLNQKSFFDLID